MTQERLQELCEQAQVISEQLLSLSFSNPEEDRLFVELTNRLQEIETELATGIQSASASQLKVYLQ